MKLKANRIYLDGNGKAVHISGCFAHRSDLIFETVRGVPGRFFNINEGVCPGWSSSHHLVSMLYET